MVREKLHEWLTSEWEPLMKAKKGLFAALILTAAAVGPGGFLVARYLDADEMNADKADAILARNCRASGSIQPQCPIVYKSTLVKWRIKTETKTVSVPDPNQSVEIADLEKKLTAARARISDLSIKKSSRESHATNNNRAASPPQTRNCVGYAANNSGGVGFEANNSSGNGFEVGDLHCK
jgi:hypothetical protein